MNRVKVDEFFVHRCTSHVILKQFKHLIICLSLCFEQYLPWYVLDGNTEWSLYYFIFCLENGNVSAPHWSSDFFYSQNTDLPHADNMPTVPLGALMIPPIPRVFKTVLYLNTGQICKFANIFLLCIIPVNKIMHRVVVLLYQ